MSPNQRKNRMIRLLARRSFAAGRLRNLIAAAAIMLTAILFTTVTTIGIGAMNSMTLTMQMLKGSKSDGDFRYMTQEQYNALADAGFIREYGLRMPVGFLTNTSRHNVELDIMDETEAELSFCSPSHGRMPKAANEVAASDLAIRELGAEPEVGAEITIEFTVRGKRYSLPMVVSGWFEASNNQISIMSAGPGFLDAYPDLFRYTFSEDNEIAGTYWSDITVKSSIGLQENMDAWSRSVGGDPENISADNYLPGIVNTMTHQPVAFSTLLMGAAVVILFIICGYLLIYNVFDISVMQEIQRYGLYRTIGVSRRQVRKLINQQAVWLSCIGIPLGLIAGFFIGKAALPVVMDIMAASYQSVSVKVSPSPAIFLGAALLTAFTVFLSTRKSVRTASQTQPIEAFRYVENCAGRRTVKKGASGTGLSRMAWSNLGRNTRRSAFIVLSLTLCVVLLNCVGIAAQSVDVKKQVNYMIRTDFVVVNAVSTNSMEGFTRRDQALGSRTMGEIAAQPGVSGASAVYKNTIEDTNVTYDFGMELTDEVYLSEKTGLTHGRWDVRGEIFWGGLGDDGRLMGNVYGMEEVALARMNIEEGETDAHILYEKMLNGEGVLVGVDADWNSMRISGWKDFTQVGDRITVYKNGQPVMELPVLAKAAVNGDDQEIGYTCQGAFEVGGDAPSLYLPASIYEELYDEPVCYKLSFNVEESQRESMTGFLEDYMQNTDPSINFASAEDARKNSESTRTMIRFVGGLIGLIFGAAGALNFTNTMITAILARRHEFATMQSIGMTDKQLCRMIICEGLYYALGACAFGLLLSVLLGFTLVRGLTESIWYFTFRFTLAPALAVSAMLLVMAVIIPVVALKVFNKGSIVEKMRVVD